MADPGGAGYGMVTQVPAEVHDPRGGLTADPVSFLPVASPKCDRSLGNEDDEHTREVDMPRRGIAVAVIVIVACFIVLGLTSDFLVDWAWFSAIGYLDVFGTILGGKAVLFFAVFAGSAILLWVNGSSTAPALCRGSDTSSVRRLTPHCSQTCRLAAATS